MTLFLRQVLLFLVFALLQVVVFDRFELFGLTTPHVFLFYLLLLPMTLRRPLLYSVGFVMGLAMGIFSPPIGAQCCAAVLMLSLRDVWIGLITPQINSLTRNELIIERQPLGWLAGYLLAMILIYEITFTLLADFGINERTLLRIVANTIYTTSVSLIIYVLFYRKS